MGNASPDFDIEMHRALDAYLNASSWSQARDIVRQSPCLLKEIAEERLRQLMTEFTPNSKEHRLMGLSADLLAQSRRVGIEQAFASRIPSGRLGEILQLLRRSEPPLGREARIDLAEEGLNLCDEGKEPRRKAILYTHLGNAHSLDHGPSRTESEVFALQAFEEAERIFVRLGDHQGKAHVCKNMGHVYATTWVGDLAEHRRNAVACYETALGFFNRETDAQGWAASLNGLASVYVNWPGPEPDKHLVEGCRLLEDLLDVRTMEETPWEWAQTQHNLANALERLDAKDRAPNLERAISACNAALTIRRRERHPVEWARTTRLLADIYFQRLRGEPNANLNVARHLYEQALSELTREDTPFDWARASLDYGRCLLESHEDGEANLERAIGIFEALEQFYEDTPDLRAEAKCFAANAYLKRRRGDLVDYINHAVRLLEESLKVRDRDANPLGWVDTMITLGEAYLKRQAPGDGEQALTSLAAALEHLDEQERPFQVAQVHACLCQAYSERTKGSKRENAEKAIGHGIHAHTRFTKMGTPKGKAMAANYLANALLLREKGNTTADRQRAQSLFDESLRYFTVDSFPFHHAVVKMNLGNLYRNHHSDSRADDLEQAIACYQVSQRIHGGEGNRLEEGRAWMNLGLAYSERIRESRRANQEQAIVCCEKAAEIIDRRVAAADWARNLNNLGTVFLERLEGDRGQNIARAITSFQRSLKVKSRAETPMAWAVTMDNLASTHLEDVRGNRWHHFDAAIKLYTLAAEVFEECQARENWGDTQFRLGNVWRLHTRQLGHLERASACFQRSAEARSREQFPYKWAQTMLHLGMVHIAQGPRYLQEATSCFEQGLTVCSRETDPILWAELENNLADARLQSVLAGETQLSEDIEVGYRRALSVFTGEQYPSFHRWILQNLGFYYFVKEDWGNAVTTLAKSADVTEAMSAGGTSLDSRLASMRYTDSLGDFLPIAMALSGSLTKAVAVLEQGKARELKRRTITMPGFWFGVAPETRQKSEVLLNRAKDLDLRIQRERKQQLYAELISERQIVHTALSNLMGRTGTDHDLPEPDYRVLSSMAKVSGSIPVYLCLTSRGGAAFWADEQETVQLTELESLRRGELQRLVFGAGDTPGFGVTITAKNRVKFKAAIMALHGYLEAALARPLMAALPGGIRHLTLIPTGPLHQVPLQMAFPGHVIVNQISSGKLWQQSLNNNSSCKPQSLLAVHRPLPSGENLPFAGESLEPFSAMIPSGKQTTISGYGASVGQFETLAPHHHVLHFAGHAVFDADDPMGSGLVLANDRILRLDKLWHRGLDLTKTDLVVLAACRTGQTDQERAPEEALGLPQAFLMAGAGSVITALWDVGDLSSSLLFKRFYLEIFKARTPAAQALRRAQLFLRSAHYADLDLVAELEALWEEEGNPAIWQLLNYHRRRAEVDPNVQPYAHPYYWAGFIYTGNETMNVPGEQQKMESEDVS